MAGGVALNCVSNGRLLREGPFEDVWIQPAAGDAGGSLGAAQVVWHTYHGKPRTSDNKTDKMKGSYLGPDFSDEETQAYLDANGYVYKKLGDDEWATEIAKVMAEENVVGLCQGTYGIWTSCLRRSLDRW